MVRLACQRELPSPRLVVRPKSYVVGRQSRLGMFEQLAADCMNSPVFRRHSMNQTILMGENRFPLHAVIRPHRPACGIAVTWYMDAVPRSGEHRLCSARLMKGDRFDSSVAPRFCWTAICLRSGALRRASRKAQESPASDSDQHCRCTRNGCWVATLRASLSSRLPGSPADRCALR